MTDRFAMTSRTGSHHAVSRLLVQHSLSFSFYTIASYILLCFILLTTLSSYPLTMVDTLLSSWAKYMHSDEYRRPQKAPQRGPKGPQTDPKGSQGDPKGAQWGSRGSPLGGRAAGVTPLPPKYQWSNLRAKTLFLAPQKL